MIQVPFSTQCLRQDEIFSKIVSTISFFVVASFFVLLTPLSFAQKTGYVTDVLYVPIRSGASNQHRIINKGLKSGTSFTILDENPEKTWTKISLSNGTQGWIPNQYLSRKRTAGINLELTQSQLEKANTSLTQTKEENQALTNKFNHEVQALQQCSNDKSQMSLELQKIKSISSGAIEMDRRYQELLEQHQITQTKYDSVLAENSSLRSDQRLSFLLYGAGLIILGMLLTILVPMLKPKRRFSEWN